jgi:hypothetical protein
LASWLDAWSGPSAAAPVAAVTALIDALVAADVGVVGGLPSVLADLTGPVALLALAQLVAAGRPVLTLADLDDVLAAWPRVMAIGAPLVAVVSDPTALARVAAADDGRLWLSAPASVRELTAVLRGAWVIGHPLIVALPANWADDRQLIDPVAEPGAGRVIEEAADGHGWIAATADDWEQARALWASCPPGTGLIHATSVVPPAWQCAHSPLVAVGAGLATAWSVPMAGDAEAAEAVWAAWRDK